MIKSRKEHIIQLVEEAIMSSGLVNPVLFDITEGGKAISFTNPVTGITCKINDVTKIANREATSFSSDALDIGLYKDEGVVCDVVISNKMKGVIAIGNMNSPRSTKFIYPKVGQGVNYPFNLSDDETKYTCTKSEIKVTMEDGTKFSVETPNEKVIESSELRYLISLTFKSIIRAISQSAKDSKGYEF